MNDLKLGQQISFSKVLIRKDLSHPDNRFRRLKKWQEQVVKEQSGIVIGKRTLSNGEKEWDSEAGYMYEGKEYFPALLVATSLNSKPVYIPMPENAILPTSKTPEA